MDTKCGTAFEIPETIGEVAKAPTVVDVCTLFRWSQLGLVLMTGGKLSTSDEPFENEMVCYPFVIEDNGRRLMFYNGNGFGQGVLVLQNG